MMPITVFVEEINANKKTCPLSFAVPEIRGADGSGLREGGPWPCCGAACMAWRWAETNIKDEAGNFTVLSGDTHGYCGLAGKPWGIK